ncbi:MAG: hypothetical protein HC906_00030 [Bacteroidales bacterium]|nr:hypothetical protein [Bacteroidales bacterium]
MKMAIFIRQKKNLDIKKYLFKILHNWYWFVLSIGVVLSAVYMINRYSNPVYSVSTKIILGTDEKGSAIHGAENIIQGINFRVKKVLKMKLRYLNHIR